MQWLAVCLATYAALARVGLAIPFPDTSSKMLVKRDGSICTLLQQSAIFSCFTKKSWNWDSFSPTFPILSFVLWQCYNWQLLVSFTSNYAFILIAYYAPRLKAIPIPKSWPFSLLATKGIAIPPRKLKKNGITLLKPIARDIS